MTAGLLPLADAGIYVRGNKSREAAARWARRHILPHVPHFHPPGAGILFCREDIDQWLARHRVEPSSPDRVDLDQILSGLDRTPRRRRAEVGAR